MQPERGVKVGVWVTVNVLVKVAVGEPGVLVLVGVLVGPITQPCIWAVVVP